MARIMAMLAAAAAALATARADRVLVLGSKALLHAAHDAGKDAAFSPAGLVELALTSFGEDASVVETLTDTITAPSAAAVKSPLLVDVFHKVDGYALIFVNTADDSLLDAIHKKGSAFPLQSAALDEVPATIAKELVASAPTTIKCVGSGEVCDSNVLPRDDVKSAQLDKVLDAHAFLKSDIPLAEELALAQQLVKTLSTPQEKRGLYVVSFSSVSALPAAKQAEARKLIVKQIKELVAALKVAHKTTSVQIVTAATKPVSRLLSEERMLSASSGSSDAAAATTTNATASNTTSATNATDMLTESDVAEYQIVLWTSVLLGATLLLIIMAMCNMDSKRDTLLYAKFTTSSARKFD